MKRPTSILTSALALALIAFSAPGVADNGLPGNSASKGNRIVCVDPFLSEELGYPVYVQSPGLCAQAAGEYTGGWQGGPGQAWKFMRDHWEDPNNPPPSNARDCISMNCPKHAQDYDPGTFD